ncbi:MAG TPA: DUF4384 domain-containing protein [Candidatus Krumholzibacteria bacterium]|nr:DUF4384 domain-containing protein [Candidatus Krumholzibacteria bacterium]
MNTMRTIVTAAALALLLPPAAGAQGPESTAGDRWVQGASVDQVYEDLEAPARDIRVQLWHERTEDERPYRRGEPYEMYFRTNGDSYVVVYRIDVDGYVEVLWPTSRYDDGFVYGNHTYTLPRPGSPVRLTAGERKGVEYVQVIASEVPFDLRGLAVDFRFDLGDERGYDYRIAGDPFLAVNDINYAITGLEEDVDYVVTDWAHLYVESQVDHARYTCTQCHGGGDATATTESVHPYVDECTTINVYSDWGWQRRWRVSFGWYPLYYEPAYYYWDPYYGRPYWFSYYPVYYSWPSYPVYARPHAWYAWHDSPWYGGDFRVRYSKGSVNTHTLYDFDGPKRRTRRVPGLGDVASGNAPVSIAAVRQRENVRSRVEASELVRDRAPTRERAELAPRGRDRNERPARTGLREDRGPRNERRLTSLAPDRSRGERSRSSMERSGVAPPRDRSGDRGTRTERRWTRPVIRNEGGSSGRAADRSRIREDRDRPTRRAPSNVERSRPSRPERNVERNRPTRPERNVERNRPSRPERKVERERPRRPERKVERSRPSRPSRERAAPQRSTPTRRSEPSRNRGGGGSSRSRERGGGGGRG